MKRLTERNRLLYQYWLEHPNASLKEIGKEFNGLKEPRVSTIIKSERERERNEDTGLLL